MTGVLDHLAIIVSFTSGQYPWVSEQGQFNFTRNPWYRITHPRSAYVERGWTWSEQKKRWLQEDNPNMRAYLLHINGGYSFASY